MKLNRTEELLFALLRGGLQIAPIDTSLFEGVSDSTWRDCYKLAAKHGVKAIAWDGVKQLPNALRPDIDLRLEWSVKVKQYEEIYHRYCLVIDTLSRIYARHGITTVQLKGVGLSVYYPVPEHREGGDIDIYTYSEDPSRMSDVEANRLADELMRQQGIEVAPDHSGKHSKFMFDQVPIENHRTFVDAKRYTIGKKINILLRRLLQSQSTCLDGKYEILTPSVGFNSVYLPFHAALHYGGGLSLHHLCDWACLLHRYGLHTPPDLKDTPFLDMIHALTFLSNSYLGTSVLVDSSCAKLADDLLLAILRPSYPKEYLTRNKMGILLYKFRRFFYISLFRQRVFGMSPATGLWLLLVVKLRSIF